MEAINIKAYTADNSQIDAIKAFMKALKIKFEVAKEAESPYNKEFVKKIQLGDEDLKMVREEPLHLKNWTTYGNKIFTTG